MTSCLFHAPTSLAEANDLLSKFGPQARLVAGGTAVGILLKERLLDVDHLIGLERLPLGEVAWRDGALHVGAMVTHQALIDDTTVKRYVPVLAEVLSLVASRRIRNVATLGGSLCWAEAASDPPGLLVVLGAEVLAQSVRGRRTLAVAELFRDYFTTALEPDEILTEVRIPAADGGGVRYLKFTPQSRADKPILGVTALVRRDRGTTCRMARVVVTAVGPIPLRLPAADALLAGEAIDGDAARRLARAYAEAARPITDGRGSEDYKRRMIEVMVRRALRDAWARAAEDTGR